MTKELGEISIAYCECPGGSDGACRHLAAVLYEIEAFDKKACTEGPAEWKRRARHHDVPTQLVNLTVKKARYGEADPTNPGQSSSKLDFDPRAVGDQQCLDEDAVKEFAAGVAEVNGTAGALEFLPGAPDLPAQAPSTNIKHLGIRSRIQQGHSSNVTNIMDSLQYSSEEVADIERATRGQSDEQQWHDMREARLTASNFHAIVRSRIEGGGTLAKRIIEGNQLEHLPAAIEWGRKKEKTALQKYFKVEKNKHKKLSVKHSGLFVMEKHGYVGASPDSVASCKCKTPCRSRWVVEVKCPYTEKDSHPKEAALKRGCIIVNNELVCGEGCKYYAQVQGQMGVCGVKHCDLVVYTTKGISCIPVNFDEIFFTELMKKLEVFFLKNILPKLLE